MSKFAMDMDKLTAYMDTMNSGTKKVYEKDEALWKPTKDKSGNAAAVIRFLPSKNQDDFPFVRLYKHNFKDASTGRWYIENSLTTIGEQDMVSTVNKELWNSGIEENKKLASYRKRKLSYISNILVIKDLNAPENNGKVMKYSFGAKIWEKIVAASKPDDLTDEAPITAFCPIEGADFLLKMSYNDSTEQYNYDSSKFNSKKAMFDGDDDKIEEVISRCFDIQLEIAPDKFKDEKTLADKFLWVTGQKENGKKQDKVADKSQFDKDDDELIALAELVKKEETKTPSKTTRKSPPMPPVSDDSDEDSAFFKSLLE